jgi:hypothetical protein
MRSTAILSKGCSSRMDGMQREHTSCLVGVGCDERAARDMQRKRGLPRCRLPRSTQSMHLMVQATPKSPGGVDQMASSPETVHFDFRQGSSWASRTMIISIT